MAFWTCRETAASAAHAHDYDEYMIVVQGCYTLIIDGERILVKAGEEYFIPRGVPHSGEVLAGDQNDPRIWRPPGRPRPVSTVFNFHIFGLNEAATQKLSL